jgi:FkbM family methyltransferase
MRWLPEGRMRQPGKYLLLHERLLHPPPEAGQPLIDLRAEAARHGIGLAGRGVLHVGAHEGRETPHYQELGMEPIVLVEANPAVYQRLIQGVGGQPGVITVQRAISDRAGQVELHLASFDQSSSLLPMDKHAEVYPDIRPAGTVSVQASRLDELVAELNLHPRQFALLHIDVQGAERLVLSGAEAVLGAVEAVSIEVNFAELYRGCAQIEVIEALLGTYGFRRVALTSPYHPSWGDALYLRQD